MRLYVDGASRGNPGPAAIGVLLLDPRGRPIRALGEVIGWATNNVAEYRALLRGLELARGIGAAAVEILTDSELMARQVRGEYRVRNPGLKALHSQALARLREFERYAIVHIPRARNAEADRLANAALDQGGGRLKQGR